VLEAGELLERFQWKKTEETEEYIQTHKTAVGKESADILYHILLLSHDPKIDISETFKKKIGKNRVKHPIEKAKGNRAEYTEL